MEHITLEAPLGAGPGPVQDYYGDYENNMNIPVFPGGNMQPYTCNNPAARATCLAGLVVSILPPKGTANTASNFFLSFTLTYGENGVAMSDLQWSNRYDGQAVFSDVLVNNRLFRIKEGSYMPQDGVYRPIPGSGAFSRNGNIQIQASIYTLIQTPNGQGVWPYKLTYP
jgi:hypothetical protein